MRKLIAPAAVLAAIITVPATAHAADAGRVRTVILDNASGSCDSGPDAGTATTHSTATFQISGGQISASIKLRGLSPNVTYTVNLVQVPSGANCLPPPDSVTLTTNARGDGSTRVTEPIEAGQTGVYALLESLGPQPPLATMVITLN